MTTKRFQPAARIPAGGESREAFIEAERAILRRCARDGTWPEMKLFNLWMRVFRRGETDARQEASVRISDFSGFLAEGEVDDEPLPSEIAARAHGRAGTARVTY